MREPTCVLYKFYVRHISGHSLRHRKHFVKICPRLYKTTIENFTLLQIIHVILMGYLRCWLHHWILCPFVANIVLCTFLNNLHIKLFHIKCIDFNQIHILYFVSIRRFWKTLWHLVWAAFTIGSMTHILDEFYIPMKLVKLVY